MRATGMNVIEKKEPERMPVPLIRANDEDEIPEITYFRELKRKEFEEIEQERKKELANKKKQEEMNKNQRNKEEELNNRPYTFDSRGELIFQKLVPGDTLPKDNNFEVKYSLRKNPISTKTHYSVS